MLDPDFIESVVDKHRQLYADSCAPSLVEMILKIEKAVDENYFEEQERDKNEPVGLLNIVGKTIHGLKFERFPAASGGITLKERIDSELQKNRVVGIFVPGPNQQKVHGWVLTKDANGYFIIAKESEDPACGGDGTRTCEYTVDDVWIKAAETHGRDVIYYEREETSTKDPQRAEHEKSRPSQ